MQDCDVCGTTSPNFHDTEGVTRCQPCFTQGLFPVKTRVLTPARAGQRAAEFDAHSVYTTVSDSGIHVMHGASFRPRRVVLHDERTGQRVLVDFDGKDEADYSFTERGMVGE